VTGIIDRMEREGLVLRERSTSDRRVVYIKLTPKGKELARSIERPADGDLPRRAGLALARDDD
jgi:DNA-binding MarR family transcriptional regulator